MGFWPQAYFKYILKGGRDIMTKEYAIRVIDELIEKIEENYLKTTKRGEGKTFMKLNYYGNKIEALKMAKEALSKGVKNES